MTAHSPRSEPRASGLSVPYPVIGTWRTAPTLLRYKDAYGRSARRHLHTADAPSIPDPVFLDRLVRMRELHDSETEFFARFDYGWTLDADAYFDTVHNAVETARQSLRLQVGAMRNLVQIWEVVRDTELEPQLRFEGLCLRYVHSPDQSPACQSAGDFGYVSVPFGYSRLIRELLLAVRLLADGSARTPQEQFAALCEPLAPDRIAAFALPFVARRLAMEYSWDVAAQFGAERLLLDDVPIFRGSAVDLTATSLDSLESALEELLLNWAVNHEVGHFVYNHVGSRAAEVEFVADRCGTDFSQRGWGWLTATGARTGLPDPVWTLLGPLLFFWSVQCILNTDLAITRPPPEIAAKLHRTLELRKESVSKRLAWLVSAVWPKFGVPAPAAELERIERFQRNLASIAHVFSRNPLTDAAVDAGRRALHLG